MALFSRVKTWVSNEILTASDLNGEFNNILNHMEPTSIEGYSNTLGQMQSAVDPYPASVASPAADVAGEFQRIRHMIHLITGKTQWYEPPVSDLDTGGIVTASLADGAVTQAKRVALPYTLSSSSGTWSHGDATLTDVTNLSVTLTTTGRPVFMTLVHSGTGAGSVYASSGFATLIAFIAFLRSTTVISKQTFGGAGTQPIYVPGTSFSHIDFGATAGTTTYKVQGALFTGTSMTVDNLKLLAYEL